MDIEQIIGFIISLLALLYLFLRQEERVNRLPKEPDEEQRMKKRKTALEELQRSSQEELFGKKKKSKHPPKPIPKQISESHAPQETIKRSLSTLEDYHPASHIQKRTLKSSLEMRSIASRLSSKDHSDDHHLMEPSKVNKILERITDRRDMIIYREIIDKPVSLRDPYGFHYSITSLSRD